jgi:hypothetical protein
VYYAEPVNWAIPPHLKLANLPTYDNEGNMNLIPTLPSYDDVGNPIFGPEQELHGDERAVETFVQKYGRLHATFPADEHAVDSLVFREDIAAYTVDQSLLRLAWAGDGFCVGWIADGADHVSFDPSDREGIWIEARDLWAFICFLFLQDYRAGKTAKCANPECLAPYFLKRRKTQKFCDADACVGWAQRQYALRWWRENRGKAKGRGRRKREK